MAVAAAATKTGLSAVCRVGGNAVRAVRAAARTAFCCSVHSGSSRPISAKDLAAALEKPGNKKRLNAAPQWGGQVLKYKKYEDYSGGGVSGKKIRLKSKTESFTFNTAVDDFYKVGDYVVINRQECEEKPIPTEPDGRTVILGIKKFKEILGKAGDPEVRYKLETEMEGKYGPKEVVEKIGPQIFQERGFLLYDAHAVFGNTTDLEINGAYEKNTEYRIAGERVSKINLLTHQSETSNEGLKGFTPQYKTAIDALSKLALPSGEPGLYNIRNSSSNSREGEGVYFPEHVDVEAIAMLFCSKAEGCNAKTSWGRLSRSQIKEIDGFEGRSAPLVLKGFQKEGQGLYRTRTDVVAQLKAGTVIVFCNQCGSHNVSGRFIERNLVLCEIKFGNEKSEKKFREKFHKTMDGTSDE